MKKKKKPNIVVAICHEICGERRPMLPTEGVRRPQPLVLNIFPLPCAAALRPLSFRPDNTRPAHATYTPVARLEGRRRFTLTALPLSRRHQRHLSVVEKLFEYGFPPESPSVRHYSLTLIVISSASAQRYWDTPPSRAYTRFNVIPVRYKFTSA